MSVNMNQIFLIAFILCLIGYLLHTISHFFEYKGYSLGQSKMFEIVLTIVIFIGYIGWFLMSFFDPIRINISDYIAVPLGLAIGVPGLALFVISAKSKRGFRELEYLVTEGIYSKLRNPMYVGIMLIHVGFPIVARSLLTLFSAIIWIPLILIWKYMEEKDLEKKFGNEYLEYKKRTIF